MDLLRIADVVDDRVPTCFLLCFYMGWDGEPVRVSVGCHVTENPDNLKEHVLDMQLCVEHSVVGCLTRVEVDFRGKVVELTRTCGSSIPWGIA